MEYHKINTCFKRDDQGNIMFGEWSCPEFEYLKNNEWVFTEKIDGTNIRVIWDNNELELKGKREQSEIPRILEKKLLNIFHPVLFDFDKFISKFGIDSNVTLYGEGFGNKIQTDGKRYNPIGVDFILFDVRIGDLWLERHNVEDIANHFGIKCVPIIQEGTLGNMIDIVKRGFNSVFGEFQAEGVVARPKIELQDRQGNRIITKLKCKDFKIINNPKPEWRK